MKTRVSGNTLKGLIFWVLCVLLFASLSGCMQNAIREDSVREAFPGIDPSSQTGQSIEALIYYRLTGSTGAEALVPYPQTIAARSEETLATAALERLVAGPPADMPHLSSPFWPGTRLVSLSQEADETFIVTMSKELLVSNPDISDPEERLADLRIRAYAIVNTLDSFKPGSRVELRIDTNDTGNGSRISPFLLGFSTNTNWLEPLEADPSYAILPEAPLVLAFDHLIREEYESAYAFFANSDISAYKPNVSEFQSALSNAGRIRSYSIRESSMDASKTTGSALLKIVYTDSEDNETTLNSARITLIQEESIWKVSYQSLLSLLEATE